MWLAKQKRLSVSIKDLLCQISMRELLQHGLSLSFHPHISLFSCMILSLHFPLHVFLSFLFALRIIHFDTLAVTGFSFVSHMSTDFYIRLSTGMYFLGRNGLTHIDYCVASLDECLLSRLLFKAGNIISDNYSVMGALAEEK